MTDPISPGAERIVQLAIEIFGDKDKAARWLRKPKERFEGRSPQELLCAEEGVKHVKEMLLQLKFGYTF